MTQNNPPRVVSWLIYPKVQVIFTILALCIIIVHDSSILYLLPYDGALLSSKSNEVIQVDKDGPAEKAGVRLGDQIVKINDNPVDPWGRYPAYPSGVKKGESLKYEIIRDSQTLHLSIVVDGLGQHPSLLLVLIGLIFLSVAFWILGLMVSLFTPIDDARARLVGMLWLLTGVAIATGGLGSTTSFWGARMIFNVTLCLLAFVGITAHLYFPVPAFSSYLREHIANVLMVISLMLALAVLVNYLILNGALTSSMGLNKIIEVFLMLSMVIIVSLLLRNRFLVREPKIRRQANIILWGTVLGFAPFFIFTLLPSIIFGTGYEYLSGNFSVLFLVFIPVSYVYVIQQRKILKIDFIINRLVVFFVLAMLVLLVSFATLGVVALIFNLNTQIPLFGGLMAALMVLPAVTLQHQVQVKVNEVLYGSHYDHIRVTTSLSSRLAQTIDRAHLTSLLTQGLSGQMGIQRTTLLLADGNRLVQQDTLESFVVSMNDEMCTFLLQTQMPVRGQYLWGLLTSQTQTRWRQFMWGQVFAPIILEKQLRGVLVLGDRVAGEVYSDMDVKIIAAVAQQAALAVANVQLVETLRGVIKQKVRSEEAHRKQVANDLHDGVLQVLFFFKQKLDPNNVELIGHLDKTVELLRHTIKAQRPSLLDHGLPIALQDLVEDMGKLAGADGPDISWQHDIDILNITDEKATSVYRIAHEAIINSIKHANAHHIQVSLIQKNGMLVLSVHDDGSGMPDMQILPEHYGLAGMEERAMMIGAYLYIDSNPGMGTRVTLEVKL